ncbi:hypothetical protein B0H14DRAFT_3492338 [Mycena olivaceomarginata]|nr:hypothetical protein B0H14DRAFT_3492338 [Mycena olivaceomarginata]
MAPGRKPLDADIKREHRRLSSAAYEAKNVDKRREAAKLRMRRRRAAIADSDYHTKRKYRARAAENSERYRDRKLEEERIERNRAGVDKRRERKLEADNIRASHMQAPAPKVKARPREGRQQPHKTQPAASSSAPKARARPRDGRQQPHNTQPAASSSKAMPAISTPTPSRRTYVSDSDRHDEDEDEDVESDGSLASDAIGRPGVLNSSVFPARVLRVGTMCKGCGLYDCPSCALTAHNFLHKYHNNAAQQYPPPLPSTSIYPDSPLPISTIMPLVLQLREKLAKAFNLSPDSVEMAQMKLRFREIGHKHLDLSVTMGNQSAATLSRIEQELKATFTEFKDAGLGVLRLELSMAYIKTHWGAHRTQGKVKREVEDQTKDGKSPASELTDDGTNGAPQKQVEDQTKDGKSPASELTDDGTNGAPDADFNFNVAPDIKVFLESFAPSLLHLYPTFVQAGITDQQALNAIASWPRFNIMEFFSGLEDSGARELGAAQTKGKGKAKEKGQGQGKLKKVVVEALVLRFKAGDYE